ncbi:asparagine synthetase B [Halovenus sp. WSH3]|uniref:Asparagine synthetase B n=1 Tax=Halovenus carboxidivorans TaxID=2692199 RepID=A0A6B0TE00_9EURY|nr:asparagine synthetase B [Halovenus carboxidivorans]MXR53160.1 asparagine synthetase B [Halovenus carboxidivorans]
MRGADPEVVRRALDTGSALPGTTGFAGELDGRLVRDVLGRVPLFFDGGEWSHRPTDLAEPTPLPAGHVREDDAVSRRFSLPDIEPVETASGIEAVRDAVTGAVDSIGGDDQAIAFSGGLDSAVLAARLDAPLYAVGFPGSHDIDAARSAAALLDRDLTVVTLDNQRLERALPAVVEATGRTNAMDIQIALPLFVLAQEVRADGYERLVLGQGADELFGGYAKVARAPDDPRVDADTVRGARREMIDTLPDQLERDVLALWDAGVEPVVPLLSDEVVEAALALPGEALVTARGERKWALRLAARPFLPDRIAFREKKAVQYGSLVARELDRLARESGFKRRQDDHVTAFIESTAGN